MQKALVIDNNVEYHETNKEKNNENIADNTINNTTAFKKKPDINTSRKNDVITIRLKKGILWSIIVLLIGMIGSIISLSINAGRLIQKIDENTKVNEHTITINNQILNENKLILEVVQREHDLFRDSINSLKEDNNTILLELSDIRKQNKQISESLEKILDKL